MAEPGAAARRHPHRRCVLVRRGSGTGRQAPADSNRSSPRPRSTTSRHRRRRPSLIAAPTNCSTLRRSTRSSSPSPRATCKFLDSDPTAEEYVPATMTFEGETIEVGLRYKGSIGAFVGCVDGPNLFDPSGAKSCTKLSMKVKINWNDGDDEFFGVRKLQLHSMNLDPSQLRERVGYHLLREMGCCSSIDPRPSGRQRQVRRVVRAHREHRWPLHSGQLQRRHRQPLQEVWPFTASGTLTDEAVYLDSLEPTRAMRGSMRP